MLTLGGWRRGVLAAIVAATLPAVLAGCSSSKGGSGTTTPANLPAAAGLLKSSEQAMKQVKSAKFHLEGKGSIAGVEVDSADGTVTSDGKAQGTAKVVQNGTLASIDLVVVGGDIYIKGPTGTFAKLPPGAAGTFFDPSQILNPDKGLAQLLHFASDPRTVDEETVNGVDAYKVQAQLDGALVSHLMPITAVNKVPGTLWIAKDGNQLVQISVSAPQVGGKTAQLTLDLSDFGVTTNITPPA
ncbi:MAG TPA: LppX_LprAFG lipoprotein [Actinomycetota bacterium]